MYNMWASSCESKWDAICIHSLNLCAGLLHFQACLGTQTLSKSVTLGMSTWNTKSLLQGLKPIHTCGLVLRTLYTLLGSNFEVCQQLGTCAYNPANKSHITLVPMLLILCLADTESAFYAR